MQPRINYQTINRLYYRSATFVEVDLLMDYKFWKDNEYNYHDYTETEWESKQKTHELVMSVPLKWGKGRIEQVQDARHAVYLVDELTKVGRISSKLSDDEIIELAQLISQLKNKRFFDARLRRMSELASVDSFLTSRGYISEVDAAYFTTLTDYWDFGNRPIRRSGGRLALALKPGYYLYDIDEDHDNDYYPIRKYQLNSFFIDGGVEFTHEKPINLRWQNSAVFHLYGGLIEGKLNEETASEETQIRIPNIQMGYYQTFGFYPNTRTDVLLGYSIQYAQLYDRRDEENNILGFEAKGAKAATNISISYYISPQFRLNVASSVYYVWQDSKDKVAINFDNLAGSHFIVRDMSTNEYSPVYYNKHLSNNFSISLIYSFF